MNKIKIILICLLIPFFVLIAFIFLKIKSKEEFHRKVFLVQEHLMLDIYQARKGSFEGIPVDGFWHEYGHWIPDNIGVLRLRRQRSSPDILEVQIESKDDASLVSNLKIRIR